MSAGDRTGPHRTLDTARALFRADLERLPEPHKRIERPERLEPRFSDVLQALTETARADALRRSAVP
jgi:hypothetical protein